MFFLGFISIKPVFADTPPVGDVTQINNNTVQIDNPGSGWTGCNGFWYAQLYGSADNYSYPIAGGVTGNSLSGSSCQTISNTSIRITFTWPYGFYYRPGTYTIFYANNNNYATAYLTNYFTITSANPPSDNNSYSTLFSDSFTDTDGTTVTAHNNNWAVDFGSEPIIQNNQLIAQANSSFYLPNISSTADQCISYDVQFPLNGAIYTWTRRTQNGGFSSYIKTDDNSYGIYDVVNGGVSYIAGGAYLAPTSGTHNIKQCSLGTTTILSVDNFPIASGASSNNPKGTSGIYNSGFSQLPNSIDNVLYQSISSNSIPTIGSIGVSINPVEINTSTSASATFTDTNTSDTHTAVWNWGDGTTSAGTVIETNGSGSVSNAHTYTTAGVYTVTLTVTDNDGGVGTQTFQYISAYNPTSQGLFSAGQKYNSPAGAYAQNAGLTGTVRFGLSYKYHGSVPTSNKQFSMDFNQANLHFNATTVSSLVISNNRATLQGTGTINGMGTYKFLVIGDGSADTIRIQIKDQSGNTIYDTQLNDSTTASPTTSVTGNVIVHN